MSGCGRRRNVLSNIADLSVLSSAFLSVKANRGCAGVDGVTVEDFEKDLDGSLHALLHEVKSKTYNPLPLLKIIVDKGNGEGRGLCIPAVRDRVVQTAFLQTIGPVLEKEFEDCSFAYRKGRSVRQAVVRIQHLYDAGYRWVVDADIDAFFDNIDHDILMKKIAVLIQEERILGVIRSWVEAEVWDGKEVYKLDRGIPQGSVISPILANLFLDELDETLEAKGYKLVRFADDFLVLCKTPEKAQEALTLTEEILDKMSLALDEADIVHFDQGFTFLGVTFIRSLVMVPFERLKKERRVLYFPPPLNMAAYHLKKAKGW
jgi:group II intron reverse transcriptase/maturase